MRKAIIVVASVATIATIICGLIIVYLHDENQRLRRNQHSLLSDISFFQTASQASAASVEVLELELHELREHRAKDAEHIKELGIRLRRAESYAKSVAQMQHEASIPLRDSVVGRDSIKIFDTTLDCHTRLSGRVSTDSLYVDIRQRDTIYQVVHRVPRKFLFFRFGTKAIRQDVWSSNPNTEIVYTEYIELSRPKRVAKRRRKG